MSGLWGGRFREPLDPEMRRFSSSLRHDRRLVLQDLAGSRAHAWGLHEAGIIDGECFRALETALDRIEQEARTGTFPPSGNEPDAPEDVHAAIEARLVELCGDAGRSLHAGRSRNDQVATSMLLWLREASLEVEDAVRAVQQALRAQATACRDLVVVAYTHLQRAQPVLLAHHLLAHEQALDRDVDRLLDARKRADRCPLGAGACVGSSLPLDRAAIARRLGFASVAINSLDAVSDRDWAVEFTAACALVMTHLSRLSEEMVLWSTAEFDAVKLADPWCTGSSMMPQKRNPDLFELVRGKTARLHGNLIALLSLLKGLPLSYNRDLQEDKEPLFDAAATTRDCARLVASALATAEFKTPRSCGPDFTCATDLAEELVRRRVPFREAHERIGRLVAACEEDGRGLADATDAELAAAGLAGLDHALLTPRGSVEAKRTLGSTAPSEVARALGDSSRRP